jgi:hypothetical protein
MIIKRHQQMPCGCIGPVAAPSPSPPEPFDPWTQWPTTYWVLLAFAVVFVVVLIGVACWWKWGTKRPRELEGVKKEQGGKKGFALDFSNLTNHDN